MKSNYFLQYKTDLKNLTTKSKSFVEKRSLLMKEQLFTQLNLIVLIQYVDIESSLL